MKLGTGCQRWRERRDSYRPAGEPIATRLYDVGEIDGKGSDRQCKAFVLEHHYAASFPNARFRFGLYRGAALVGVAIFSHPQNDRVLTNVFPGYAARDAAELGRFVLLDDVPANGETWFLARCWELLRDRVVGVVSFSDPVPRTTLDGRVIHPGHVGTIYQAFNGCYLGKTKPEWLHLLANGTILANRALSKLRKRDQGWLHTSERLVRAGAEPLRSDENATEWLDRWLPRISRPLHHTGNHRYAWALDRALRRSLTARAPYPKLGRAA
jgi:hypothetical protein